MSNQMVVSNYDKLKALARNQATVSKFVEMLGSRQQAMSYIASAMLVVANSDDLQQCEPASVFNSVMRAAALRLSCDPSTKQAHLVPFYNSKKGRKEAQLIPGYVGLNQLALRTRKYRNLNAGRLYEGQIIEVDQLTGKTAIRGIMTSRNVIGYFHYLELHDGYSHTYYMTAEELRAHGEKYAPKNAMWRNSFDAMALKTVTRMNLLKYGVLDPDDRAILEEAAEDVDGDMIPQENTIDATFTDDDVEQAVSDAQNEPQKPQKTQAEIMNDLGFSTDEQPASEPAAVTAARELGGVVVDAPPMTYEEACAVENSKGQRYGDIDTATLEGMVHGINIGIKKPGADVATYTKKLKAIGIILAARENDAEAARAAENE